MKNLRISLLKSKLRQSRIARMTMMSDEQKIEKDLSLSFVCDRVNFEENDDEMI